MATPEIEAQWLDDGKPSNFLPKFTKNSNSNRYNIGNNSKINQIGFFPSVIMALKNLDKPRVIATYIVASSISSIIVGFFQFLKWYIKFLWLLHFKQPVIYLWDQIGFALVNYIAL